MEQKKRQEHAGEGTPVVESGDDESTRAPTDEWTMAALAHASVLLTLLLGTPAGLGVPIGLAVPLVMYFGYRKQSSFVAFHALQAFVFQVAGMVCIAALGALVGVTWAVAGTLAVVIVGLVLMPLALTLTLLLLAVVAAVPGYGLYAAYQVYQGRRFRYWSIGDRLEREVSL